MMSMLLRLYPWDARVVLLLNLLVQLTLVILVAELVARSGRRRGAAWRHTVYLVALFCVVASPVLSYMLQSRVLPCWRGSQQTPPPRLTHR